MALYTATIEILINAINYGEACDAVAEAARNLCHESTQSGWIDWQYRPMENSDVICGPKLITKEEALLRFEEFAG